MKENENANPLALEYQLKNQKFNSSSSSSSSQSNKNNIHSDWELVEQIGAPSYYWNRVTNETTYTPPTVENNSAPPPPPPPPPKFQLPGLTQQNNKPEQVHHNNEQVDTIEDIQEQSEPKVVESLSEEDQGWLSCQNNDGTIYYWNYLTNDTLFTLPSHLDPNSIPPYVPETVEEENNNENVVSVEDKEQAESDPSNWIVEWDDYYQANYYRNKITETLQWNSPDCLKKNEEKTIDSNEIVSESTSTDLNSQQVIAENHSTSNDNDNENNNSNNNNENENENQKDPIVVNTIPDTSTSDEINETISNKQELLIENHENHISNNDELPTSTTSTTTIAIASNSPPPPPPPPSIVEDLQPKEKEAPPVIIETKNENSKKIDTLQSSSVEQKISSLPEIVPSIDLDVSKEKNNSSQPPSPPSSSSSPSLGTSSSPPPPPPPPRKMTSTESLPISIVEKEKPVEIITPVISPLVPQPINPVEVQLTPPPSSSSSTSKQDSSQKEDATQKIPQENIVVDIDHEMESHENEAQNQNNEKDDEVLTGDGSKPVGCTSCSIM